MRHTMLQGEAASTPLPASPKSVLQAEASSTPLPANTKSGSTDPVKVPEYLHGFCSQILKDWNEHFPYSHDTCLVPFITKDSTEYSINWDKATQKNVSVIMLWSDNEEKKSRSASPKL